MCDSVRLLFFFFFGMRDTLYHTPHKLGAEPPTGRRH